VTSGRQDVTVKASQGVPGDAFIMMVGGPSGLISMTFHRPIGATGLANDDWVSTPTEDVVLLLGRVKNPGEESARKGYEVHRSEAAVARTPPLLQKRGGKYYYPGEATITRDAHLSAATAAAKAKLQQGRNPTKVQVVAELPEALRAPENSLSEFMNSEEVRNAARAANPVADHETRGGPFADRPQVAIPPLKGMNSRQAQDAVLRRLCGSWA